MLWQRYGNKKSCPFKLPNSTCLLSKYFCDFPRIKNMNEKPIKEDNIAVMAKIQLVANIIIIEPMKRAIAATKVPKD